ncbi:hypothetical protein JHK87_022335 [Glycine soja]|nr:hypothetical protein JHK87_022335 [Glycine soja]
MAMNMYIPTKLIEEMLVKLHMKSLLGLKCVRKEWNYLISHLEFAKRHFKFGQWIEKLMIIAPTTTYFCGFGWFGNGCKQRAQTIGVGLSSLAKQDSYVYATILMVLRDAGWGMGNGFLVIDRWRIL